MKNLMKVTFIVAFVVALLGAVNAQNANALTLVSGDIDISGLGVSPTDSEGNPVENDNWLIADGITFAVYSGGIWDEDSAVVTDSTGDFSSVIEPGASGDFSDFLFAGLPVEPLWTINGVHFDLLTVTVEGSTTATNLDLSGSGLIYLGGFDPTPGVWTLSTDGGGPRFSFSSTTQAVPEPGTIALLGMGLVGLIGAGARRKLKKKS